MLKMITFFAAVVALCAAQDYDPRVAGVDQPVPYAPGNAGYGYNARYDPRYSGYRNPNQPLPPRTYIPNANRNPYQEPVYGPPRPYNNAYNVQTHDGGAFSQDETGDEFGAKRGSYTIQSPEGFVRTVDYVADEFGFRATVRTNEPGTLTSNAADATYTSDAVPFNNQPGYAGYVPPYRGNQAINRARGYYVPPAPIRPYVNPAASNIEPAASNLHKTVFKS